MNLIQVKIVNQIHNIFIEIILLYKNLNLKIKKYTH